MPTYAELATEAVYNREYEPAALAAFNSRLRAHFGHDRTQTTSRGDNRHLTGRHRSRAWVSTSRFCTNRSYGTRDGRDTRGPADALRATDLGVQGQQLRDVSARMDAAVRAGLLPEIAEWFGTVDGRTVVGWYEGHASSSDSSHLYHLHLGYWTEQTDNAAFFGRLFAVITGGDEMEQTDHLIADTGMPGRTVGATLGDLQNLRNALVSRPGGRVDTGTVLDLLTRAAQQTLATPPATVDVEALATAIVAKLPASTLTAADVRAVISDVLLHGATPE